MTKLTHNRRRALRVGTALTSGMLSLLHGLAAFAQDIPDTTMPTISNANGADITTATTTMTVNLTDVADVTFGRNLVWSDFSIGADNTVSFVTDAGVVGNFVALNTVTNAAPISTIEGAITTQSNIAVWLINEQGMLFRNGASFSGGSLVLSTLPASTSGAFTGNADIIANGALRLEGTGNATTFGGKITVEAGASLGFTGGLANNVILVAQDIDLSGDIKASGGISLVLAKDVTFASGIGSPLSFTINEGIRINGNKLLAKGTIEGASVMLAAATRDAVTTTLLQVDSGALLTASLDGGSVVLTTSQVGAAGGASPVRDILVNGSLLANNVNGSVSVTALDSATVAGTVTASGTGTYSVSGKSVTLGGSTVTQSGGAGVSISSSAGNISAQSGLTLTSGGTVQLGATGGGTTVNAAVTAGNHYLVTGDTISLGGSGTQTAVNLVDINSANGGTVTTTTGMTLSSSTGNVTIDATGATATLRSNISAADAYTVTADAVTLGGPATQSGTNLVDINATDGNAVTETGLTLSSSAGNISVDATNGDLTTAFGSSLTTTTGDVLLTASGSGTNTATLRAAVTAGRDYIVSANAIGLGGSGAAVQAAKRHIDFTATTGDITGAADVTLSAGTVPTGNLILDAGSGTINFALGSVQTATGSVGLRYQAGSNVSLGTVTGQQIRNVNGAHVLQVTPLALTGNLVAGSFNATAAGGLDVTTTGSIRLGSGAGQSISLTGADITGLAGASVGTSDAGFGRVNLTSGSLTTINADGLFQAGSVTGPGSIVVNAGNIAASGTDGSIDITTASSSSGLVSLTAWATSPFPNAAHDGDILIGSALAPSNLIVIDNKTGGGTAGDVVITGKLGSAGNIDITSTNDVKIAAYDGANIGSITSTTGSIAITADGSVYNIGGTAGVLPVVAGGNDGYGTDGNIIVRGDVINNIDLDARIGNLVAGGNITFDHVGSLVGGTGSGVSTVAGGALFAQGVGGTVTVKALANGSSVVLDTIKANAGVTVWADKIAIGQLTPGAAPVLRNNDNTGDPDEKFVGINFTTGDLLIDLTDPAFSGNLISVPGISLVADEELAAGPVYNAEYFDVAYGKANLQATGTITGTLSGAAQLGSVSAGGLINLTAGGLVADSVSAGGGITLVANTGTLSLRSVSSTGDLNLTKNGGLVATAGDDLRVVSGTATGAATLLSETSIRIGSLTSNTGAISLTATQGDISGLFLLNHTALPATATTATVLSADWDKAGLTATVGAVTATANNGGVQLGTLSAGTDITADALALTADSADADGAIDLAATSGTLYLGTGSAGLSATLAKTGANDELRFGTLTTGATAGGLTAGATVTSTKNVRGNFITANSGQIQVSATGGEVTGTSGGRLVLSALGDLDLTPASDLGINVTSGGLAKLGNLQAGTDILVTAGPTNGTVDMLSATSLRGDVRISAANTAGLPNGISFVDINAGDEADVRTSGIFGGSITGHDVIAVTSAGIVANPGSITLHDVLTTNDFAGVAAFGGDVTLTTLRSTLGSAQAIFSNNVTATTIQSGSFTLISVSNDAAITTIIAGGDLTATANGNIRVGQATSSAGNVLLTATNGDISGLLTGAPGALPTFTNTTQLSTAYNKASLTATLGSVTVSALNGGAQLGTVTAGTDIVADAKGLTADTANAGGLLDLAVTDGTLYFGTGTAGLSATLGKTGANDELRFGTLLTGAAVGGTSGAATLTSSTDIRGTSVTARGGSIAISALAGDVTGTSGGRLALSAVPDLDGTLTPIALTDGGVTVISGGLAKLGNLLAGANIGVQAGTVADPAAFGAIDVLNATSLRGNVQLLAENATGAPNGISFVDLSGLGVNVVAEGVTSGSITGHDVTAVNTAIVDSRKGAVTLHNVTAGQSGVRAEGGDVTVAALTGTTGVVVGIASNDFIATTIQSAASTDITATRDISAGSVLAGSTAVLTAGRSILAGQVTATTGNVTLRANGGDITGLGGFTNTAANRLDITATAGAIDIVSTGSTQLDSANAGTTLKVVAGTATSDGEIEINTATAAGSIELDSLASAPAADGDHDGGITLGTASAGSTLKLTNVARGTGTGNIAVTTSATAATDATIDAAGDARLAQATATAGTLAIRAGGEIRGLTPGSSAQLLAGEDIAVKSGAAVNLAGVTAGDDLIVESASNIVTGALSVSGTGPDARSVSFASPTAIAITAAEPNPGASIVLRSTGGSVTTNGQLTAPGTIAIDAATAASVTGGVDAGTSYTLLAANDIQLGGAGPVTQTAKGAVTITSTSGQVTQGAGTLTLTANSDAVGAEALTITAPAGITLGNAALSGNTIALTATAGSVTAGGALTSAGNTAVNAGNQASITGDVTSGGDFLVTAANGIQLGGSGPTTQSAKGAVTITSTAGQVTQGSGALTLIADADAAGAEALTITAPGGIVLGDAALSGGAIALTSSAGSVTTGGALTSAGATTISAGNQATISGAVTAGGDYAVTAANAVQLGGSSMVTQSAKGAVTIISTTGQVTQGSGALTLRSNSDGLGTEVLTITAPTGILLGNAALFGGDAGRQSAIVLTANNGQVAFDTASAARLGVVAKNGFTATGAIVAGNAALPADPAAGPSTVDIAVATGDITAQAITATGAGHDIRLAASGSITTGVLDAAGSVFVGGATSGTSAGSFTAPSIAVGTGAITVAASTMAVAGSLSAGTNITLDITGGALQAGALTAANGDITIASTGKTTLNGAVTASGHNVTVTASDADIGANITAAKITIVNRGSAGNALRIGASPSGTGGFVLDQAEFDRLIAPALVLDAGTGTGLTRQDVAIGGLTIGNAAVKTLDIQSLGRIDLTGNLETGAASTLTALRLGGSATATELATVLRVAAAADGTGGLIDVGTATLELRAATVGVGQDAGFLDSLGAKPGSTSAVDPRLMVNALFPGLYDAAQAGGGAVSYTAAGQQLIRAASMTVRYSNFALFQNTAQGTNEGVVLGSQASPSLPALRILGQGSADAGPFALFGQINGIGGIATALLGETVVNVAAIDRTVARINGCLIGSGAGCLTAVVLTPTLGTFDPVKGSIFFAKSDFELPFDPLVGTNNDSLFGDVGTFGLSDVPLEPIDCTKESDASCAAGQDKDAK